MERVTHKHVPLVIFQQRDATLQWFLPLFLLPPVLLRGGAPPCRVPMLNVYYGLQSESPSFKVTIPPLKGELKYTNMKYIRHQEVASVSSH